MAVCAAVTTEPTVERDAPIPTWFRIGGRADRLARPASVEELRWCLATDPRLRVLGDGANLLVDDPGVGELVVALTHPAMSAWRRDPGTGLTHAMAGASLFRMIPECVRQGLCGLETLAGIPATVGGAVVMNAGGRFGQISDAVVRIHAIDRAGRTVTLERAQIEFGYRRSALNHLIIVSAELNLVPDDPQKLRDRFKEFMAYKKSTQPMADNSAGCVFKNPTLAAPLPGIGDTGQRISAGLLIDRAGCKGLSRGGATVSDAHANFIVTHTGARAADVIELMNSVRRRVGDTFGVELEPEIVIWRRER